MTSSSCQQLETAAAARNRTVASALRSHIWAATQGLRCAQPSGAVVEVLTAACPPAAQPQPEALRLPEPRLEPTQHDPFSSIEVHVAQSRATSCARRHPVWEQRGLARASCETKAADAQPLPTVIDFPGSEPPAVTMPQPDGADQASLQSAKVWSIQEQTLEHQVAVQRAVVAAKEAAVLKAAKQAELAALQEKEALLDIQLDTHTGPGAALDSSEPNTLECEGNAGAAVAELTVTPDPAKVPQPPSPLGNDATLHLGPSAHSSSEASSPLPSPPLLSPRELGRGQSAAEDAVLASSSVDAHTDCEQASLATCSPSTGQVHVSRTSCAGPAPSLAGGGAKEGTQTIPDAEPLPGTCPDSGSPPWGSSELHSFHDGASSCENEVSGSSPADTGSSLVASPSCGCQALESSLRHASGDESPQTITEMLGACSLEEDNAHQGSCDTPVQEPQEACPSPGTSPALSCASSIAPDERQQHGHIEATAINEQGAPSLHRPRSSEPAYCDAHGGNCSLPDEDGLPQSQASPLRDNQLVQHDLVSRELTDSGDTEGGHLDVRHGGHPQQPQSCALDETQSCQGSSPSSPCARDDDSVNHAVDMLLRGEMLPRLSLYACRSSLLSGTW